MFSPSASSETERALWYQWYFNIERGRAGLSQNRRGICRLLWETWSPSWRFTDETFNQTAASFDNPDFVDVVIHSYRHRNGNAPGEARFAAIEQQLASRPKISVPSIVLYGGNDGVSLNHQLNQLTVNCFRLSWAERSYRMQDTSCRGKSQMSFRLPC